MGVQAVHKTCRNNSIWRVCELFSIQEVPFRAIGRPEPRRQVPWNRWILLVNYTFCVLTFLRVKRTGFVFLAFVVRSFIHASFHWSKFCPQVRRGACAPLPAPHGALSELASQHRAGLNGILRRRVQERQLFQSPGVRRRGGHVQGCFGNHWRGQASGNLVWFVFLVAFSWWYLNRIDCSSVAL